MDVGEILHRSLFFMRRRRWRKEFNKGLSPKPSAIDLTRITDQVRSISFMSKDPETLSLINEAKGYLDHKWRFFDLNGLKEYPIDWHRDPKSEKTAPRCFGPDVNHRDQNLVGNIKNTWEKNRHHHLTVLSLAFHLTRDEDFALEVAVQIEDWIKQNPYLAGVNWTHPLEQGIRLLSWIWCWRLLQGSRYFDRLFNQDSPFWDCIYQHQLFIEKTYSKGSSANNHLIGEMVGMFCAATVWPIFPESSRWKNLASKILEREIIRQTYPTGINREMAFAYHIFSLEFFILAIWEARQANDTFSGAYKNILKAMVEVIPTLTDFGGNLPAYGDEDQGMAVQLRSRNSRRDFWLLEAGHNLVNALVPVSGPLSLPGKVLGFSLSGLPETGPENGSAGFEDAGIYVLASNRKTDDEIFILAQAGPLGYLGTAAHGHAHALSFTLSRGGVPILIDPGTYCYHDKWEWRKYFRGTTAHNTLCVDGLDQSVQAGPFLWARKAEAKVHQWQPEPHGGVLEASHDGYTHLGIIHHRKIELNKTKIVVLDRLEGNRNHDVTLNWHFHPGCQVKLAGQEAIIFALQARLVMKLPLGLEPELIRGGEFQGWYSPCFGVKEKTITLVCRGKARLPGEWVTEFEIS